MARPETVGVSTERLKRIDDVIQRYMDEHKLSGAVTLVARRGKVVHYQAQGLMDLEAKTPMRRDAIFRMASSSKPVTAVAILMLVEEGKVRLSDPVSRFLPEFKKMNVAVRTASGETHLEPANREITIRDLLTHTSGLMSGLVFTPEAIQLMQSRGATDTLATFVPKFATLALDFQPGTQWRYSGLAGIDTLGRIVEIASGLPFDRFLRERIFQPLGMNDTFFVAPDDRQPRLAKLYRRAEGSLAPMASIGWLESKTYFSGAGGLSSTAADYFRFAQMLCNGGELNGHRILSPRSVALMSTNQVGEMFVGQLGRPKGMGFGFAVEVVEDSVAADTGRSNGSFGWDGAFGTHFWVDPKEQLVAVLMVQTPGRDLRSDYENAVGQAVVK